jgi:hypothetical protein
VKNSARLFALCSRGRLRAWNESELYAKLVMTNMERNKITGGCYCAEVRFGAAPQVRVRTNCHCANCRRAAGAQAVAWITVKRSQFQFEKGTPHRYQTEPSFRRVPSPGIKDEQKKMVEVRLIIFSVQVASLGL